MAQGWFRRPKQKLVYVWQIEDPKTGRKLERAKVIGNSRLSDEEGWQIVGKMKAEGTIPVDPNREIPSGKALFRDISSYYLTNKMFKKLSTKALHTQIINEILKPRWGDNVAVAIKPKQIKDWLYTIEAVEDTTRHKYKNVMGVVYRFAQSEGLIPLGEQYNPAAYVIGIPSVSDYEAIALTPEEVLKVLEQLQQPEYMMIVLVAATGIRASELLGLRWSDIVWGRSEIKIRQTYVHGNIQVGAKTKLSKSAVTMHPVLAQLLKDWRAETAYSADGNYVFASSRLGGTKPRIGSMVVEDYLQPAAIRAGVLEVKDGKRYIDGEFVKRFGFHTFRHSLTSWLMANGGNPQIVRAMLRWTNFNMLAHYSHGFKSDKLEAQGTVLDKLVKSGVKSGVGNE
jgi:integrase